MDVFSAKNAFPLDFSKLFIFAIVLSSFPVQYCTRNQQNSLSDNNLVRYQKNKSEHVRANGVTDWYDGRLLANVIVVLSTLFDFAWLLVNDFLFISHIRQYLHHMRAVIFWLYMHNRYVL